MVNKSGCKVGQIKVGGKCQKVKTIDIRARRWFDKTYGNTYHSVVVHANNKLVGKNDFEYGYDEGYLQTAHKILQEAGIYKKTGKHLTSGMDADYYDFIMDKRKNRNKFRINVYDVSRKRDL